MDNREIFVKGYKIDNDKLRRNFTWREDDPGYLRFLDIWQKFPEPFLYLTTAMELDFSPVDPGAELHLVVVLADGYDKEALEREEVVELSEPYTKVFTLGIWVKH
jgi:hypothetical protein